MHLLFQGQLVYALLYSLHMVQVAQKVSRHEFLCPRLVSGACLLALELSNFRMVATSGTIKLSEHNWLLKLENMMCEYLRSHPRQALHTINVYLDAYKAAPTNFFNDVYPLTHLEIVGILTLKVLVATIDAQWEGMGDVGSARYELALLSPCRP